MDMFEGLSLISDPIHGYISFTVRHAGTDEICEEDILDTEWMQRLRYIFQLQSARWVFPSAEHSRFQHSIGTMHIAGNFAKHLYPSLHEVFGEALPSANYIEELLRMAGLLHDIGHGPFGHFFDDNYLDDFGYTHESVGALIIVEKLGELITSLKRSPGGPFAEGERLKPWHIAYLINKHVTSFDTEPPGWLTFLRPLLGGIYTVDNMDYVLRDSYMCGVAIGPVDINRLTHYSFFSKEGLTLHKAGLSALIMFLNSRFYLYSNVYYHRTTRALDLHLKEVFKDTIHEIYYFNPEVDLNEYASLTDWFVIETAKQWIKQKGATEKQKKLGKEWADLLQRKVKWKMAYETTLSLSGIPNRGISLITDEELRRSIKDTLPEQMSGITFAVDMASQDPRPVNPLTMGEKQIYVLDPMTQEVSKEALKDYFTYLPAKVKQCRVYTQSKEYTSQIHSIAEGILNGCHESSKTNL